MQQLLLSIPEFIGHLHPVLVHLPIGILLIACLFIWQARKDKYAHLQPAINIILLLGMISAIVSCVTGFILSQTGDYDEDMVSWHQWMGISVAIFSVILYYSRRKPGLRKWQWLLAPVLVLLIFITGHLGGSLTHGSDYLTLPLKNLGADSEVVVKIKPIPNVQEAVIYTDIIKPIFQSKCYGCHGPTKQKGKLRLDQPDLILKGGKDGVVIVSGNSVKSDLVKRVMLPREEEHHMAPKEKPQLTSSEKSLLAWWIDNGADFTKKVKEVQQPDKIKPLLIALQKVSEEKKSLTDIPAIPVEKGNENAINKLRNSGVLVQPVSTGSNYLEMDFVNTRVPADSLVYLLPDLKKQLVRLKMSGIKLTNKNISSLSPCVNIRRLELDHTGITDSGLVYLLPLFELQSLNLVGNPVTTEGVMKLRSLKHLQSIYLYQTRVAKPEWKQLAKIFPGTALDSGGYSLPFIASDTVVVKPPKINP
ncbi:MAG TPA: c-type cytochrome domain-containing protein [Puia sp.]